MGRLSVVQETSLPADDRRTCRVAHPTDGVRVGLLGFGLLQVAAGILLGIDPGVLLGPLDGESDHYVRDLATFELPLGVALLAAVRLIVWRVPILAFAALHWALLALSHLVGLGAAPQWPSIVNVIVLTVGAGLLGWLLTRALRAERWDSA